MIRRVVIDTNVLVSALIFTEGRVGWLRRAWQHDQIVPVACRETVAELARVLTYPKLQLSKAEQDDLLADVLPYMEVVTLPETWPDLPECRDRDDQIFLVLAASAGADALVTGDDDLLALVADVSVRIVTPAQFAQGLPDNGPPA